jgi:pyroglutamyl-peptidase
MKKALEKSVGRTGEPRILVTAFGPFEGRAENASHLALLELKRTMPSIRTRILPVDSVRAPSRLREAVRSLQPDLLILLGEAAGSGAIRLETSAWNQLDFRIPDNAGRQPCKLPIEPGGPDELRTTLPLEELRLELEKTGHTVMLSSDPGRFLCNQIYYISRRMMDCSLFVHLPLASDLSSSRAASAIRQTILHLKDISSGWRSHFALEPDWLNDRDGLMPAVKAGE